MIKPVRPYPVQKKDGTWVYYDHLTHTEIKSNAQTIHGLIGDLKPDAYETYKGYLLHANDPKVQEYSDPSPLYSKGEVQKFADTLITEVLDVINGLYHKVPLEQCGLLLTLDEKIKDHFYRVEE